MIDLEPFLGIPWAHETADCYALMVKFYKAAFGLELTDYARPPEWFLRNPELDLIRSNFRSEGFVPFDGHVSELQYGDALLIAYGCSTITHCGVHLGNGWMLHHPFRGKSERVLYAGKWLDRTMIVARNPACKVDRVRTTVDLMDLLTPAKRQAYQNVLK